MYPLIHSFKTIFKKLDFYQKFQHLRFIGVAMPSSVGISIEPVSLPQHKVLTESLCFVTHNSCLSASIVTVVSWLGVYRIFVSSLQLTINSSNLRAFKNGHDCAPVEHFHIL